MAFVDFARLKQLVSLQMVVQWLGLTVRNNRCQCPHNEGDNRELVLVYDRGSWTCFGCKKKHPNRRNSGDAIELVAHCLDVSQKQAAEHIQTKFTGYTADKRGLPESGLDYLVYDHESVADFGLTADIAEELGIGYAPRGTMTRRVLFPLRDKSGKLLGYVGIAPGADIKLPKSLAS
jgi:hypothetical protein